MYGLRTAAVQSRIDQVRMLTPHQLQALGEIWVNDETSRTACTAAYYVVHRRSTFQVAWQNAEDATYEAARKAAQDTDWGSTYEAAREAALEAVLAEMVAAVIAPKHVRMLTAPLVMVHALPPWWSEPGARSLFLEMLSQGVSVRDACGSVGALV